MIIQRNRSTRWLINTMMIICVSIFLLMQAAATAQGQESVPRRGLYSTATYDLSGLESINTTNGNLLLNIPLASLPPGRGGDPGFTLQLHYNSKLYNAFSEHEVQPNGSVYSLRILEPNEDEDEGGWRYNLRYELSEETLDPNCNITGGRDVWKLRMTFPDGSAHEFRPLGYDDSSNNGFFSIRHDGGQPCGAPTAAGPRTYYSADGSYLRLVFPNDGVNPWTLYFPDGGRLVGGTNLQGGPQRSYDRNGNFVDVLYSTLANGHNADKIVDSLGRSIVVEHDAAARQDYITTAALGEELKWTVKWGATYVNKTYQAFWGCSNLSSKVLRFGHSVVEQITLPVQANSLIFKFEYNGKTAPLAPPPDPVESPGWGELSAMTLPSGAKIKYHYFHDDGEQPPATGTPCWRQVLKNYPVRKELVYRDENDRGYNASAPASNTPCAPATEMCVSETWNYNMGQTFATTRTLSTITDPSGRLTKEFYFDSDGGSDYYPTNDWRSGLVYKIENPDGTVIERDWQANTPSGNGSAQMNPYVKFEYTSVPNGGQTTLVKTAGKEFNYDKNGNVIGVKEYDWVNYGSNPTLSSSLLRQTVNEYYNPTPDASSLSFTPNSYHAATWLYVWRSIYSSEVHSSSGQVLARTEYSYDNPTLTANLKGQVSWDSSKGGYSNPLCTNASLCAVNVISVSHQYDGYGNRTLSIDAGGHQTKLIYGSVGAFTDLYPTTIIRAFGTSIQLSTSMQYDFNTGLLIRTTDSDNNVSNETDYNALGRAVEFRTSANVPEVKTTTRIEYSDVGRYIITRSDLNTVYDGKLVSIQHFDQLGRIRLTRQLEDAATQNAADETVGIKVQTRYLVSGSNSYQLVTNPYRATVSFAAGSETSMGWTRSKNNSGGRLVEVQMFGGAVLPAPWASNTTSTGTVTTAYNAELITVSDQASRVRRSLIDGLGRLTRVDEPDAISGNLDDVNGNPVQATFYTYDALDNLRQVTQGSQTRTFVYNSLKRLTSGTNPESGTFSYQYDANGNLTQKTDARGVVTTYAYDVLNRNISVTYSNDPASTPAVHRYYDGWRDGNFTNIPNVKGRLWQTETSGPNGSRTTINSFDALGRPLSQSQQFYSVSGWSQPYTVQRTPYNPTGAVTTQTSPSGHPVAYTYDAAGRTNSFTGYLGDNVLRSYSTEITYSPLGAIAKEKFGTDTAIYNKLLYNSRGQLSEIREGTSDGVYGADWNRGKVINWYSLQCGSVSSPDCMAADNNGNLRKQELYIPNSDTFAQTYEYDSLNRLQSVRENKNGGSINWKQTYIYDRYGNRKIDTRVTETFGGVNNLGFEVDTDKNRLYAPGDPAISNENQRQMQYDTAGNLKRDTYTGGGDRTYDAENRMTKAWGGSNQWQEYTYNAEGQRVRRKVDGVETWQVYGLDGELLVEYAQNASSTSPKKEYGYRNGQLLITADAPTGTNVALAANGGTTLASSSLTGCPASKVNDGDRRGGDPKFWADSSPGTFTNDWVEVDFSGSKTINRIDVVTLQDNLSSPIEPTLTQTFSSYGATQYDVEYLNGSVWTAVTGGNVTGNDKVWRQFTFTAITTTKIRVVVKAVPDSYYSRIVELEAWDLSATSTRTNVARSANGATATAQNYTADSVYPGHHFQPGYAIDGQRFMTPPWGDDYWRDEHGLATLLEIAFAENKTIDEVDVYTVQDSPSYLTGTDPGAGETFANWGTTSFNVEYWTGSGWAAVTGSPVTGNNLVWKKLNFAAVTTSKIRVTVSAAVDGVARLAEVEAWGTTPSSTSNINWLVTDQLGTPRMIFDKTGSLAEIKRHDYLPFGEEISWGTGGRTSPQGYGGAADGVRQKFTSKERDIETGLDFFEARYHASVHGRFTSPDAPFADQSTEDPQSWNLYSYVRNNPLVMVDPTGRKTGDYYNEDGSWAYTDYINDNRVYVLNATREGDGSINLTQQLLPITHTEFTRSANIVRHEGATNDADEYLWIAHASNNEANATNSTLYNLLQTGFSSAPGSVKNTGVATTDISVRANAARAGVLDAVAGRADPTGGARRWDGTDFLAWGLNGPWGSHAKFREFASIHISGQIFSTYENAQIAKWGNSVTYSGTSYTIPATVFTNAANWTQNRDFHYVTGARNQISNLVATGAKGQSIFWRF